MNHRICRVATAWALATTLLASGCAVIKGEKTLKESLPFTKKKEAEEPYPNPTKMAVTWTPDVIIRTGSTPTRGFGGRVFFYDEKTRPVPVEGELAVQAIRGKSGEEPELKRYAFTPEQFTKHYSPTDLGASYSIWIPWDAAGGDETKITLTPSFKTPTGQILQGTSSVVALPGKSERDDTSFDLPALTANAAGGPAEYAGGAWSLGNLNTSPQRGLTTTTIPVNGSLARRFQQSQPARAPLPGTLNAEELLARLQQPKDASKSQASPSKPFAAQNSNVIQAATTSLDAKGSSQLPAVLPASAQTPLTYPQTPARSPSFQLPRHPNDRRSP